MNKVLITGSGFYVPPECISNAELVASFNTYVEHYNREHAAAIAAEQMPALRESSEAFIVKASGVEQRYVVDKKNILDPAIMRPILPERDNHSLSLQAEMAVKAAQQALAKAQKQASDVDIVIVACSTLQRAYPGIAMEVQGALGCGGYAYDMLVACSSATFALQAVTNALKVGQGKVGLVICPEISSGHMTFQDRDSHFLFGDASAALVLETPATCQVSHPFEVISTRLQTQFSNNIRNNFGFLNWTWPETAQARDKWFTQQGRVVFKEVVPMAAKMLAQHVQAEGIAPQDLRRVWLHQANKNMNDLIAEKLFGHEVDFDQAPLVLNRYGNTASAGSVICFDHYHDDMKSGDYGLISSFGAGYSIGSVIVRRL